MFRTFALFLLQILLAAVPLAAQEPRTPRKHALLVAIDNYPSTSGYDTIHASNDIPLVRSGLLSQGFAPDDMTVMVNQEATREGIVSAIRSLGERAASGDVVVFFYAGHGCQITDDNGDEPDGYDEAIVPFDAVDRLSSDPAGSRHLRDDELNRLVAALRAKIGAAGNVVMLFDACNSGSVTRGPAEAPVRGRNAPLGPPAPASRAAEGAGTIADPPLPIVAARGGADAMAPCIVISACQHYQSDHEIIVENEKGELVHVGPLSYALARALPAARPGTTYRVLFERIKTLMASETLLQEPQMEGDADVALFSGSLVDQGDHFPVVRHEGSRAVLRGGTLVGLLPGTTVAIHPSGTMDPSTSKPLAVGRVTAADHLESTVELDDPLPESEEGAQWGFVREYAFQEMQLRVMLDRSLDKAARSGLRQNLKESGLVELVDALPEVLLRPRKGGGSIELLTLENDTILAIDDMRSVDAGQRILETLRGYARAKYLRRLEMTDNAIRVEIEIVPVEVKWTADNNCNGVEREIESARTVSSGGQRIFRTGDSYMLRIRNTGSTRAWISVLAISANGTIQQMYPDEREARDNQLGPGGMLETRSFCYTVGPPYGTDVIKVFATRDRVDFAPVIASRGSATRSGSGHPLERVLAETYAGSRGGSARESKGGQGATAAVTIIVAP